MKDTWQYYAGGSNGNDVPDAGDANSDDQKILACLFYLPRNGIDHQQRNEKKVKTNLRLVVSNLER